MTRKQDRRPETLGHFEYRVYTETGLVLHEIPDMADVTRFEAEGGHPVARSPYGRVWVSAEDWRNEYLSYVHYAMERQHPDTPVARDGVSGTVQTG